MRIRSGGLVVLVWVGVVCGDARAADPAPAGPPTLHPKARVETSLGGITLELDAEKAPITVLNFIDYVEAKFYDGTIFHRVVPRSVIQGGAFLPDLSEKKEGLRAAIKCESFEGLLNERGTIAMYRVPGSPNTAKAQFFINLHDNPTLDKLRDTAGYTVFGRVVEGMEVIERIKDTPTSTHPRYAAGKNPVVPVTPVVIQSIRMTSTLDRAAAESLSATAQVTDDVRLAAAVRKLEAQAGSKAIASASGLRWIDAAVGHGAFPLVSDAVEMNLRGTLVNGAEFENSKREKTGAFTVNVANLTPGLREGVLGMQEGGKRVVIVPPELGYGAEGIPGRIPHDATLIYEVEVLAVRPPQPIREIRSDEGKP